MYGKVLRAIRRMLFLAIMAASVSGRCLLAAPVPSGAIEAIDRIAGEDIEQKKAASYSVAVVKDSELVLARGYGFSDLENDVPATPETVYRLGSITKQFTSMAIMQLVEAGKVSLDDELSKFVPDFPTGEHKVTVHHLLNHTSGIQSYTSQPEFFAKMRLDLSHNQLLDLFKDKPFSFEPGTKWAYNNSGYYLLGMIIEKASGHAYEQYLVEHIFRPLDMSATHYGHMRPLVRHRAMGYRSMLGQLVNDDPMSMNPPGAAGALVSNVLDLVKWHQALEDGKFLSSGSYEAMYRETKLADGATRPYGYGWGLGELSGHKKISHGGGINGFSTMIARYPNDRLAVIVLSNTAGANPGGVERKIAKVMLGIEDKPVVDLPADAALLERLVGKYQVDDRTVELTVEDGKLYATPQGRKRDLMKYQGGGEFVSATDSERRLKFPADDGPAKGFELEIGDQKMTARRAE